MVAPVLETWSFEAAENENFLVFPDGCRDVIAMRQVSGVQRCFLTELDDSARAVRVRKGECYRGFRLRPSVSFERLPLSVWLGSLARKESGAGVALGSLAEVGIQQYCHVDPRAEELLHSLGCSDSVSGAAKLNGNSVRTFHRLTIGLTERTPQHWIRLGRVRRAAKAVESGGVLSRLALEHGYSDQAHMTREFRRWFSVTPAQVQKGERVAAGISQSGYDV